MEAEKTRVKRGREQFKKFKKVLNALSKCYSLLPLGLRIKWLVHHRETKGYTGLGIRYALLKSIAKFCGDNVSIHTGVYLLNPQNISIGDNVSIHPMCYMECGTDKNGGIQIHNDVSIAHGVTIMATAHMFSNELLNIKDQSVKTKPVVIHNNVWIGAKATILSGIQIASGCIVGAGAVVTKSTEVNGIYVGVPAHRIKDR